MLNKHYPRLTQKTEQVLIERMQEGDISARNKLIEGHMYLPHIFANKSRTASDAVKKDLVQSGMMGLLMAAEKFKVVKNVRFATYAQFWVRQQIDRALIKETSQVKVTIERWKLLPEKFQYLTFNDFYACTNAAPTKNIEKKEQKVAVQDAIKALSKNRLTYVREKFFGNETKGVVEDKEVGKKLGVSQQAVGQSLHRSYKKLARNPRLRQLAREGGLL